MSRELILGTDVASRIIGNWATYLSHFSDTAKGINALVSTVDYTHPGYVQYLGQVPRYFNDGVVHTNFSEIMKCIMHHSGLESLLNIPGDELNICWIEWAENRLQNGLSDDDILQLEKILRAEVFINGGQSVSIHDFSVAPLALDCLADKRINHSEHSSIVRWLIHLCSLNGSPLSCPILSEMKSNEVGPSIMDCQFLKDLMGNVDRIEINKSPENSSNFKPPPNINDTRKTNAPVIAESFKKSLDDFSRLQIIVGTIIEVWPHPDADKLWCEKIDCGVLGVRSISSGLRHVYQTEDQMLGRKVLVLANLKPKKLRGFSSHGMVLCAQLGENENAKIEIVPVPPEAENGDIVKLEESEFCAPDEVLNAKKNPFDQISKHLLVSSEGNVCYKNQKWMVHSHYVISSLPGASIS